MPAQYGLLAYAGARRLFGPEVVGQRRSQRACVVTFTPSPTGLGADEISYRGHRVGGSIAYGPEGIVPFTHRTGHSLTWAGGECRLKLWLSDTETFECWLTQAEEQQFLAAITAMMRRQRGRR